MRARRSCARRSSGRAQPKTRATTRSCPAQSSARWEWPPTCASPPQLGSIEIGHVWFGPSLRRTTAATEAIYLLASNAFDALGYRRLEWKCNSLNAASRGAAERFGFSFEGIFHRHMVVKGRNRDTAWFAITDDRWPAIRSGFQAWLAPENFDRSGRQRQSLSSLIEQARRGG